MTRYPAGRWPTQQAAHDFIDRIGRPGTVKYIDGERLFGQPGGTAGWQVHLASRK